jgi:Ser-tRNA(Ala) deacylase AlaX
MVSASESSVGVLLEALPATKLVYFDDMWQLQAHGRVLTVVEDGDCLAVIMNQTIMYPQGGGQPCDTGNIISVDSQQKFRVEDVRSTSGLV